MYKFIDKEYPILERTLLRSEIIRGMDESGYIEGAVSVSLSDLIDNDLDNFLDFLADKLIGSVCFSDINYKIIGCSTAECSDEVLLLVSGHADEFDGELDGVPDNIEMELPESFSFSSNMNSLTADLVYKAERFNEHGDYRIRWGWNSDDKESISQFGAHEEYYAEREVKHFIKSGQWV